MQAAAYMRVNKIKQGVLYIDHVDGPCDAYLRAVP
ncbi:hypothetical protein [Streptomyces amritsarensis]